MKLIKKTMFCAIFSFVVSTTNIKSMVFEYDSQKENQPVNNALELFKRLNSYSNEIEAWSNGTIPKNQYSFLTSLSGHFQCIVRWKNYFLISRGIKDKSATLSIIKRQPNNKLKFVQHIKLTKDPLFWHAGGMQVCGNYVAIPLEGQNDYAKVLFFRCSKLGSVEFSS